LAPDAKLIFQWQSQTIVSFHPQQGWPRGQSFTLTVDQSARSQKQQALDNPYTAAIKTSPPLTVLSITPADKADKVPITTSISIPFNRPVVAIGQQDSPLRIAIKPAVDGKGQWVTTSLYVFKPKSPLDPLTRYSVTVPDGVAAADGSTLAQSVSASYHT